MRRNRYEAGWSDRTATRLLVFLINVYRHLISPLKPASCRFVPTCSQYAVDALTQYGVIKGSWLSVIRLIKCGPWHRGGLDPIPEKSAIDDVTNIKGESLV